MDPSNMPREADAPAAAAASAPAAAPSPAAKPASAPALESLASHTCAKGGHHHLSLKIPKIFLGTAKMPQRKHVRQGSMEEGLHGTRQQPPFWSGACIELCNKAHCDGPQLRCLEPWSSAGTGRSLQSVGRDISEPSSASFC